ncbi:MAG: LL-diaminopimelate aminotransferase [Chlamydiales bacterium]|nr:LL-diaminopimelate aminotransferase [Chlamydiales bacterium]
MIQRNDNVAKLSSNYLFVEIANRKRALLERHPHAHLISLGIGDTTLPIPKRIAEAMADAALRLATPEGYTGYGTSKGRDDLCAAIAKKIYQNRISSNDIFISDGAKCDIGRLQHLFPPNAVLALQDPAYPAYIGCSVINGHSGEFDPIKQRYDRIIYLASTPENHFFPDLNKAKNADVLFFCAPNNPTGTVYTRKQLQQLVDFALDEGVLILYDTAYASYIDDPAIPKSIYEIPKADQVAIETGSFSKSVGFTGVRLGWTVVPEAVRYQDGTPIRDDWMKVISNCFNGASNIVQAGGLAALTDEGLAAAQQLINYYRENAALLKDTMQGKGYRCYGGDHAPYIWVDLEGKSSWDMFDHILQEAHIITTPGAGFGPDGEGFLRLSAFGSREQIADAAERLKMI